MEDAFVRAKGALRTHIGSSREDGHGPKNSLPEGVTEDELEDYIEPVTE